MTISQLRHLEARAVEYALELRHTLFRSARLLLPDRCTQFTWFECCSTKLVAQNIRRTICHSWLAVTASTCKCICCTSDAKDARAAPIVAALLADAPTASSTNDIRWARTAISALCVAAERTCPVGVYPYGRGGMLGARAGNFVAGRRDDIEESISHLNSARRAVNKKRPKTNKNNQASCRQRWNLLRSCTLHMLPLPNKPATTVLVHF